MEKGYQKLKHSNSVLEVLRIERTNLNQKQFAEACSIPLKTYQRWILGKTEARPTLIQLKNVCRILQIKTIEELPDNFSQPYNQSKNEARNNETEQP